MVAFDTLEDQHSKTQLASNHLIKKTMNRLPKLGAIQDMGATSKEFHIHNI